MAKVWVFVEETDGAPSTIGLELLTKARDLGEVTAIYLGSGGDPAFAALGDHGACSVRHADAGERLPSGPLAAALAERVAADQPDLILAGQAYTDRDVAGRLAARLGVGVLSNAADVRLTASLAALMLAVANVPAGLLIAWFFGRWVAVREALPAVVVIATIHGLGQWLLAPVVPTLATVVPATAALVAVLWLAKTRWYRGPSGVESSPVFTGDEGQDGDGGKRPNEDTSGVDGGHRWAPRRGEGGLGRGAQ